MTRKTLTLSEQAYNALDHAKGKNKTAAKVIRRRTRKKAKGNLLEYVRSIAPDKQLADSIEKVLKKRNSSHLRGAGLNTIRKKQMCEAAESMDRLRESSKTTGWSGAREIRKWRDTRRKS